MPGNNPIRVYSYGSIFNFHIPYQDFRCFYPCEIILSHIPVPGRGKKRTAARRPHAGRTSIRGVFEMFKLRFSANSGFSGFFFHVFQYEMRYLGVSKKKNLLFVWGWDRKKPSLAITVCHNSASLVIPISDLRDGLFSPTFTPMMASYIPQRLVRLQS